MKDRTPTTVREALRETAITLTRAVALLKERKSAPPDLPEEVVERVVVEELVTAVMVAQTGDLQRAARDLRTVAKMRSAIEQVIAARDQYRAGLEG